jgi:hypothetical protein
MNLKKGTSSMPSSQLKCIVRPFKIGDVTRLNRSGKINWRPGKFFLITLMEEHKTVYSGLMITGMALSNQNELEAFFSPRQVNL